MKQEALKLIGQERLSDIINDRLDVREAFVVIEELLNMLDISEDDLEEPTEQDGYLAKADHEYEQSREV